MYCKLDGYLLRRIERVGHVTGTNYELLGDFVPVDSLICMVEDLLLEVDHLSEEIERLEQDIEDNYRPIPIAEQVGVSDRDFI